MTRLKLGILISGRGSNMAAVIEACETPGFPAEVVLVVSNVADAGGLQTATAAGVATTVVDHRAYTDRESFDAEIDARLRAAGVELVCLAGFMRLLTAGFVAAWQDRMINIHPSLLPAFKGLHVHERVLDAGARVTGCTVHFVRPEMDTGPIIVQAAVPVLAADTPDSLAARVLRSEHTIYPHAIRLIAEGRARVIEDRVILDGVAEHDQAMISPPPVDKPLI